MDVSLQLSSVLAELMTRQGATEGFNRRVAALQIAAKQPVAEAERPALCSALGLVGCQLAQFGEQLAAELESCAGLTPPQAEEVANAVYDEYILACQVATAATSLCSTLGDAAAAAAFQRSVCLLLSCGRELLAAAAARRPPFANPARKLACEMPHIQLGFMLRLLQLEPASMESAAEPDALVSWLACLVGAMRTLHAPLLDKGRPPPPEYMSRLAGFFWHLFESAAAPASYREALRRDAALCANLVALVEPGLAAAAVALALPAEQRPPFFTWRLAYRFVSVLSATELSDGLAAHLTAGTGRSGGNTTSGSGSNGGMPGDAGGASAGVNTAAQRLLSAVARLLELAMQEQGEEALAQWQPALGEACSELLFSACTHVAVAVQQQQCSGAWQLGEGHLRLMRTLAKAIAQMPHAVRVVSQLPASLARRSSAAQRLGAISTAISWIAPLQLLHTLHPANLSQQGAQQGRLASSLSDFVGWCTAAAAALRALPEVDAAAGLTQRLATPTDALSDVAETLERLVSCIMDVTHDACAVCTRRAIETWSAGIQELRAAFTAFMGLLAPLCRCAHWVACGSARHLACLAVKRLELLTLLADAGAGALQLADTWAFAAPPDDPAKEQLARQARAAGAAIWEAVQALVAGHEDALLQQPDMCTALARAIACVSQAGQSSLSASPELLRLLQDALPRMPQGVTTLTLCRALVLAATSAKHLMPGLLGAGLYSVVEQDLQAQASGSALDHHYVARQPLMTASMLKTAISSLIAEGEAIGCGGSDESSLGSGGVDDGQAAAQACRRRVGQAAQVLRTACEEGSDFVGYVDPLNPEAIMVFRRALLRAFPPALALTSALQEWWALPEQVAATRLATAQAAAARSCANLRCANLGLEGGVAAGEGAGCRRCSGCRVSYYCGTACSHADWYAGHRKVCRELAAARRSQRQSRPQS